MPPADVVTKFEALDIHEPALDPLLNWLEDNYIGRRNRRGNGRQQPRFRIELWNQYQNVIEGKARTNNHVEGWHRGVQGELQMVNPTLWKCIDALQSQQQKRDTIFEGLIAGHAPNERNRLEYQ